MVLGQLSHSLPGCPRKMKVLGPKHMGQKPLKMKVVGSHGIYTPEDEQLESQE